MARRKFIGAGAAIAAIAMAGPASAGDSASMLGPPDCQIVNGHPHPGQRATWSGGCLDGKADGEGVLDISVGDKLEMHVVGRLRAGLPDGPLVLDSDLFHIHYEGAIVADHFEGAGTLTQPDGTRLTARFSRGEPDGDVDAVMPGGVHYHGQWKDWLAEGRGEALMPDGGRLTGWFHKGLPDGPAVAVMAGLTARGVWQGGHQTGAVVLDFPGKFHYEGDARDLGPEGAGVMTDADGVVYRGFWVAGKRQGQGTLTAADGHLVYSGGFAGDRYDGQGRLLCANGAWYEGAMSEGWRKGHGKMTGPMGVMEGEFSESAQGLEFRGVLVNPLGDRAEGRWVNERFEGEMLLTTRLQVQRASYHNGLLDGPSDSRYWGGTHVSATYRAGVLDGPYHAEKPDGSVARGQYHAGLQEGSWEIVEGDGKVVRKEFLRGEDVTPPEASRALDSPSILRGDQLR